MAEVIGTASSSKDGLQRSTTAIESLHISALGEYTSRGRIKIVNNGSALFIYNPSDTAFTSIIYISISSSGRIHVADINNGWVFTDSVRFYYDDNYIYYEKQYGGVDSLVPLSSVGLSGLTSVSAIPTDATSITVSTTTTA